MAINKDPEAPIFQGNYINMYISLSISSQLLTMDWWLIYLRSVFIMHDILICLL